MDFPEAVVEAVAVVEAERAKAMKSVFYFLASFAAFYFIFLGHFTNSEAKELESTPGSTPVGAIHESPLPTNTPLPTSSPTSVPEVLGQTEDSGQTHRSAPTDTPLPTDTPVPTPTPDVWSPPEMEPIFARYAGMYGVDKNVLERLAVCESHFDPNAVSGDYVGMFQFSTRTWQDYRMKLGLDANPDLRRDVEASIQTAAYVVQQRGTAPWPRCLN